MSLSMDCFIKECKFLSVNHHVGRKFVYAFYRCSIRRIDTTALNLDQKWSCKHFEKGEGI